MQAWQHTLRTVFASAGENDVLVLARPAQALPAVTDLPLRLTRHEPLASAAREQLPILSMALGAFPHVCATTDEDGVVLEVVAHDPDRRHARSWVPGSSLFEASIRGTLWRGRVVVLQDGRGTCDVIVPAIALEGVPFGTVVLACEPERLDARSAVTLMQTARAIGAVAQLLELQRQQKQLMGMMGHELRQPLSALVTALDLIGRTSTGVAIGPFRVAQRQALQLVRLVDALLDASRVLAGKLGVARRLIDLRPAIDAAIEEARAGIEGKQQRLVFDAPGQAVWCLGDPSRLQQVIANLLTNAHRYTPTGGTITIVVDEGQASIEIRVTDTGMGIDAMEQDRIFEPFVQHTSGGEGLGLGLAISRAIAQMHGGSLSVESEGAGRGATFVLEIPCVLERHRELRLTMSRTRRKTQALIERARLLRASLAPPIQLPRK